MVGDRHRRLRDVVGVVRLLKLVAETGLRVEVAARITRTRGDEGRVDGDADDVVAGRHRSLAIAAVEHEILPGELPDVFVGPAVADALVSRNSHPASVAVC